MIRLDLLWNKDRLVRTHARGLGGTKIYQFALPGPLFTMGK